MRALPAPPPGPPTPREQYDAEDARDAAILAEREAKAAAECAALDPDDAAARTAALEKREAAVEAERAAQDAERLAEEAKRRPPVENPDAPGSGAAPAALKAAPDAREQPAPQPEPEPQPKEWWEERAKWSPRGPIDEDARRGRPMYECIHEYDPLAAEEDYDPFE